MQELPFQKTAQSHDHRMALWLCIQQIQQIQRIQRIQQWTGHDVGPCSRPSMPAVSISIEPGQEKAQIAPLLRYNDGFWPSQVLQVCCFQRVCCTWTNTSSATEIIRVNRNRTNKINKAFRVWWVDSKSVTTACYVLIGSTRWILAAQNHAHIPMFGRSSSDRLESLSAASTSRQDRQEELEVVWKTRLICKDLEVHSVQGASSNRDSPLVGSCYVLLRWAIQLLSPQLTTTSCASVVDGTTDSKSLSPRLFGGITKQLRLLCSPFSGVHCSLPLNCLSRSFKNKVVTVAVALKHLAEISWDLPPLAKCHQRLRRNGRIVPSSHLIFDVHSMQLFIWKQLCTLKITRVCVWGRRPEPHQVLQCCALPSMKAVKRTLANLASRLHTNPNQKCLAISGRTL